MWCRRASASTRHRQLLELKLEHGYRVTCTRQLLWHHTQRSLVESCDDICKSPNSAAGTPSQDQVPSTPMHLVRGCLKQSETLYPGLYRSCCLRPTSLDEAHESVRLSPLLKCRARGIWLRCAVTHFHPGTSPSFTQAPSHRVFGRSRLCSLQQKLLVVQVTPPDM